MTTTITVNGEPTTIATGTTIADIMAARHLTSEGTAVAVDAAVVPASAWAQTVLADGAEVDILTAVQGG